MADEPTSASGGSINVRNIRAERQLSREMTVERLTVNTGEERNAESDLLNEVRDVITDQTTTLESAIGDVKNIVQMQLNAMHGMAGDIKALKDKGISSGSSGDGSNDLNPQVKKLLEDLRAAIVSMNASGASGGGGDEGGGSSGSSGGPGDSAAQARQFRGAAGYADEIIKTTPSLQGLRKAAEKGDATMKNLFKSGIFEQFRANLINLGDQIQSVGNNLMDMSKVYRFASERFQLSMEAATSGVAEMGEVFRDIMPGIRRGGDNLTDTFKLVRDSLDADLIGIVGIVGSDLMEVSEAIHSARMTMRDRGVDAAERLDFRTFNEATQQILALERRRDINANLQSIVDDRSLETQLNFAQLIATNTGRTADEVIRMNAEHGRELANLEAGGILQGGERENFERAINVFATTTGMRPVAEMLAGIARAGGSMELFLDNNPEMANDLAILNQIPQLRGLIDVVRGGGGMTGSGFTNALMGQVAGFGTNANIGVAGAAAISGSGVGLDLAGAGNMARNFNPDSEPDGETGGIGLVRRVMDFGSNNLAGLGIMTALGSNTLALIANTRALGGGLFGGGGGGGGRGRNRLGRLARIVGRGRGGLLGRVGLDLAGAGAAGLGAAGLGVGAGVGAGAGARAGLGAAARGVGLGAVLRGIPGLGLLAGLAQGGYYGLVQGDWASAGLAAGSGIASTIPGLGTAASIGLSGALVTREASQAMNAANADPLTTTAVGPASSGAPTTQNAGIRTETQRLMVEHNRLLDRIVIILEEQTGILERVGLDAAQSTIQAPTGFWDGLFGDREAESASPAR